MFLLKNEMGYDISLFTFSLGESLPTASLNLQNHWDLFLLSCWHTWRKSLVCIPWHNSSGRLPVPVPTLLVTSHLTLVHPWSALLNGKDDPGVCAVSFRKMTYWMLVTGLASAEHEMVVVLNSYFTVTRGSTESEQTTKRLEISESVSILFELNWWVT